jgi:hypothetical protein
MYGYISEDDILVIIYPNKLNPELVIILDPYDKKIVQRKVSSIDEIKEALQNDLPFCSQGHSSFIHLGNAYVVDWTDLPKTFTYIKKPEDIEKIQS